MYSGKILMLLAISVFLIPIGVAQAGTPTPYAVPSITTGDNVVTLSPSNVPAVQTFRRRGYYRYWPYSYSYGYYPYYRYYGSPYYYSYRWYPYRYYSYGPYAYGW
jgi:hypothetical protein